MESETTRSDRQSTDGAKTLRLGHLPRQPGLLALRYTFDVAGVGGEPPYFCVFEAEFADVAAFGAAMGSPEGAAVAADGPNYAKVPPVILHYTVESSM